MLTKWFYGILLGGSFLMAEEVIPKIVDFGQIAPSCHATGSTWSTGQLAFNGAPELGTFLTYLKKAYSITSAVETGTYLGNTTVFLSLLFDEVYTVEVVEETYHKTSSRLKDFPNVQCLIGSSENVLAQLLPKLRGKRVLFYLDAHWDHHWPLRDELKEIAKTHYNNCVIIIDDFKVPGRQEIPFDKYKENECSLEYIKDQLKLVFSEYEIHYIIPARKESRAKFVAVPKEIQGKA